MIEKIRELQTSYPSLGRKRARVCELVIAIMAITLGKCSVSCFDEIVRVAQKSGMHIGLIAARLRKAGFYVPAGTEYTTLYLLNGIAMQIALEYAGHYAYGRLSAENARHNFDVNGIWPLLTIEQQNFFEELYSKITK